MSNLKPIDPPIGYTQFINTQQQVRLVLKDKVVSVKGDAFDIAIPHLQGRPGRAHDPEGVS